MKKYEDCLEIEKKFLINNLEEVLKYVDLNSCDKLQIEQGYLCNNPTVRIRKYNEEFCITYKSRGNNQMQDDVIINQEVELPLTGESYYKLREKIDYNLVEKTRYKIPLENGLIAELDVFKGKLEGLLLVEVEFENQDEASRFIKPRWFGKNVSADLRYKNLFLAQLDEYNVGNE